jgi:hypothetical protein
MVRFDVRTPSTISRSCDCVEHANFFRHFSPIHSLSLSLLYLRESTIKGSVNKRKTETEKMSCEKPDG